MEKELHNLFGTETRLGLRLKITDLIKDNKNFFDLYEIEINPVFYFMYKGIPVNSINDDLHGSNYGR